jgi:hypothetical protein
LLASRNKSRADQPNKTTAKKKTDGAIGSTATGLLEMQGALSSFETKDKGAAADNYESETEIHLQKLETICSASSQACY